MKELFFGLFADVVFFPEWAGALIVVLIVAVVVVAIGLLVKLINKRRRYKNFREEEK